jgi:prepilin-type N-terminal cleavage/methylation domain-containing protein
MRSTHRLKGKSGFSLIECIIAIAVFSILALFVAMLLNNAMHGHRDNLSETRSLRAQRRALAGNDADAVVTRAVSPGSVPFQFSAGVGQVDYVLNANVVNEVVIVDSGAQGRGLELNSLVPVAHGRSRRLVINPIEVHFTGVTGIDLGSAPDSISSVNMSLIPHFSSIPANNGGSGAVYSVLNPVRMTSCLVHTNFDMVCSSSDTDSDCFAQPDFFAYQFQVNVYANTALEDTLPPVDISLNITARPDIIVGLIAASGYEERINFRMVEENRYGEPYGVVDMRRIPVTGLSSEYHFLLITNAPIPVFVPNMDGTPSDEHSHNLPDWLGILNRPDAPVVEPPDPDDDEE